jgi:hypothetical protein
MTKPSSTSKCKLTPLGRNIGPLLGIKREDGGLRKKKGCFGRELLSSFIWSLEVREHSAKAQSPFLKRPILTRSYDLYT